MNPNIYSNDEFAKIRERINKEILRRGTYRWNDPLTVPKVGEDRNKGLTFPTKPNEPQMEIDEKTYTINNPSRSSIERTRNIVRPAHGDNPGGDLPYTNVSADTSARRFDFDEMRNFLVGLSKIYDIDLYYGRDERAGTVFRNPNGIENTVVDAENSKRNALLKDSDIEKLDGNGDPIFPMEDGEYVMPSGETDGEEFVRYDGLNPRNFYDDHGASPGDADFHPYNPHVSDYSNRSYTDEGEGRNEYIYKREGYINSSEYGPNPRNPNSGKPYRSRPVMGGVLGACNVACTGLCHQTCDSECSESCSTTCWDRCGEACTSSCGNYCTGCSTMCYDSCRSKCENTTGFSCINAGARAVKIWTTGGSNGNYATNHISSETYRCRGCSFSCQYYPNKKTQCWDSACMGQCFTSCMTYCSTSCFGGCIDNANQNHDRYKTGIGRGCSTNCTINCVGACVEVCEGVCVKTCFHACEQQCHDNCELKCYTICGSACANKCKNGCGGCSSCEGTCEGYNYQRGCLGCGTTGGCIAICKNACDTNCVGYGCRSVCGMGDVGSCEANCRMNCTAVNCTSKCDNACSSRCTACVNGCNINCGPCTSQCSAACGQECNITCTNICYSDCANNCTMSCTELCGGCSTLCYSCVNKCIGVCSQKCQTMCSLCTNNCGSHCDSSCGMQCVTNCDNICIKTCSGSCITFVGGKVTQQDNFLLIRDAIRKPNIPPSNNMIIITVNEKPKDALVVYHPFASDELGDSYKYYCIMQTTLTGGIFNIDKETGEVSINEDMIPDIIDNNIPNPDGEPSIWIIVLYYHPQLPLYDEMIQVNLPFGFTIFRPFIKDVNRNLIVIIEKDKFIMPGEEGYDGGMEGWNPYA